MKTTKVNKKKMVPDWVQVILEYLQKKKLIRIQVLHSTFYTKWVPEVLHDDSLLSDYGKVE